jgi:hypothetical protein
MLSHFDSPSRLLSHCDTWARKVLHTWSEKEAYFDAGNGLLDEDYATGVIALAVASGEQNPFLITSAYYNQVKAAY